MIKNLRDTVIVSFSFQENGKTTCVVGRKNKGEDIDIIKACEGDEARAIYASLTDKKEVEKKDEQKV